MIEPMSVERIRDTMQRINWSYADHLGTESHERAGLILAWASERAQLNEIRYAMSGTKYGEAKIQWNDADWLNEVLDEIGWPKAAK